MKIEAVTDIEPIIDEVKRRARSKNKVQDIVLDFFESQDKVIKIMPSECEYAKSSNMTQSFKFAIKRLNLDITDCTIKGCTYLIKTTFL